MSYRYTPTAVRGTFHNGGRPRSDEPRYPFAPLLAASGVDTLLGFARITGEHYRQVQRWKAYGLLWDHADRVACALTLNPVEVWPDYHRYAA